MYFLHFRKPFHWHGFCLLVFVTAFLCAHAQDLERTGNGAVIHSAAGLVRVEVCSDSVIHIVAGPAASHPEKQLVPTVIQPCSSAKFTTSSDGPHDSVLTTKVKVEVDKQTGSVRFLTVGGNLVLSEQLRNGRTVSTAENSCLQ